MSKIIGTIITLAFFGGMATLVILIHMGDRARIKAHKEEYVAQWKRGDEYVVTRNSVGCEPRSSKIDLQWAKQYGYEPAFQSASKYCVITTYRKKAKKP